MLIQELERVTGLDRPTIRYYEKEGLVSPERAENGYRTYSNADAENLIRIKLMRQLGVPIGKIRQLQDGTERFSDVMDAQIEALSSRIDRDKRARNVCSAILNDGAEYASLNAKYYLEMFEQKLSDTQNPVASFKEQTPLHIHPWRRYIARSVDYFIFVAFLDFIVCVILRIRPVPLTNDWINALLGIAYGALFIPVEALMLHLWGTTPGKLAMGIRIERIEGGFLSYSDALERAKRVYFGGVGLSIPVLSTIVMFRQYCALTGRSFWRWARYDSVSPPYEMDWDYNNEIHYEERGGKNRIALICLLAAGIALFTITINDSYKPKHRGEALTVEQFAVNYNNMVSILFEDPSEVDKLQPDGSWRERDGAIVVSFGGEPDEENKSFDYDVDMGTLRGVSYSQHWSDVSLLSPIGANCQMAAITMLMAQDGADLFDLTNFLKMWEDKQYALRADFQYDNIRIQWTIETKGNLQHSNGMFFSVNDDIEAEISVDFSISLINE